MKNRASITKRFITSDDGDCVGGSSWAALSSFPAGVFSFEMDVPTLGRQGDTLSGAEDTLREFGKSVQQEGEHGGDDAEVVRGV